ncbi:MAG: nitroreductase family protein [Bacteroides sp.]|nr:nitroreductase family protein [Bacteroides sp.]
MLLSAEAMGLGAVWTAASDEERSGIVRESLGLPENNHPLCVVPVGHPDGDFQPKDKWDPSKIHYNQW